MTRLEILNQIEAKVSEISKANGYLTDIGKHCEYWATTETEYEQGRITFRDEECEVIKQGCDHEHRLTVEIEAIAFSSDPKTTGCNLLSDIYRAVGSNTDWGGNAESTLLVRDEKAIATEGGTAVKVLVEVEILYRSELWEI